MTVIYEYTHSNKHISNTSLPFEFVFTLGVKNGASMHIFITHVTKTKRHLPTYILGSKPSKHEVYVNNNKIL